MHLEFPFTMRSGTALTANDDEWVVGLIEQVLFTLPGERVNRPDLGCGVGRLVFERSSAQLASAVQYLVKSELQRWLAGIADIREVTASNSGDVLSVSIEYLNLVTRQTRRVTLPRSG
jgi:uncharacterized protein